VTCLLGVVEVDEKIHMLSTLWQIKPLLNVSCYYHTLLHPTSYPAMPHHLSQFTHGKHLQHCCHNLVLVLVLLLYLETFERQRPHSSHF
jgi:hypothetical protein